MHKHFSFPQGNEECPVCHIVDYINKLYTIELLKQIDIRDVDLQTAWQYGEHFETPWRENLSLNQKFLDNYKPELYAFVYKKAIHTIRKLVSGIKLFTAPEYKSIPMEPNLYKSIVSNLSMLDNNNYYKEAMLSKQYLVDLRAKDFNNPVSLSRSAFADVAIAESILKGLFNHFTFQGESYNIKSAKHHFGSDSQFVLDTKFSASIERMEKLYRAQLTAAENTETIYNNFFIWGSLLNVIYHLAIPSAMHPNNLDRMYEKYILGHENIANAIDYARRYSGLKPSTVLCCGLPMINDEFLNTEFLSNSCRDNSYEPNSLVEKYLVTQFLVSK